MKELSEVQVVLIVLVALMLIPLAAIWSINTLFELAIPYTFKTWLAAMVLAGLVGGTAKAGRK